jgi:hypothetical protein
MNIVKVIPKSQRAKNRVIEHGEQMELLVDSQDSFMVRSLEDTWKYREGVFGKWVGTLSKEEAEWEEI